MGFFDDLNNNDKENIEKEKSNVNQNSSDDSPNFSQQTNIDESEQKQNADCNNQSEENANQGAQQSSFNNSQGQKNAQQNPNMQGNRGQQNFGQNPNMGNNNWQGYGHSNQPNMNQGYQYQRVNNPNNDARGFYNQQNNPNQNANRSQAYQYYNNRPHNADFGGYNNFAYSMPQSNMSGFGNSSFWAVKNSTKSKNKKTTILAMIVAIIALILISSIILVGVKGRGWLGNKISGNQLIEFTLPIADTPKLDDEFYDENGRYTTEGIAEAISPSIVSIEIYSEGVSFISSGQGSGIIMSEDGYILTNAHVIADATKGIKVVLNDETEYEAKVIGSDATSDVAVIKIAAKDLTPAQFGDSTKVKLGEDIVTIGSPAGFYGTVTKGIVSGIDRKIKVESSVTAMNCFQIDAAINPGNSGGALLNMWGQVIGITSSKLASSEYEGIGFAITMDAAKPIIENLMEFGYVKDRVRVGITYYPISETTAEMQETKPGLYVVSIDESCDVAKTKLEPDDIITELDGKKITDTDEVQEFLADKKPGDTVKAKVFRPAITGEGEEFEISFKLMEDKGSLIESSDE